MELHEIIEALGQPAMYPCAGTVEIKQTHASAVFIAGNDVYKLKKPVDFGFLDYHTLDRRREMCHLEVELNRRLTSDVYLGVIELVERGGKLQLGGEGEPVDYLVHMRRLPDDASLGERVRAGKIECAELDRIAQRIACFHRQAGHGGTIDRWGTPAAIARNVEENFEQIEPFVGRTIARASLDVVAAAARRFLEGHQDVLFQRLRDGMIRDGHGDIRSDHVYLLDGVQIIDCIEFNERIRCGDVASDVGFLAMDLDALNRPDLADRLVSGYVDASGWELEPVLDFYRSYRAVVRGKVTSFRLDEPGVDDGQRRSVTLEARRFFHLAQRYSTGDRGPRLILTSGVTGTGKSTLARALAEALPADIIDSDTTRKQLAGLDPASRQEPAYATGLYSPEMSARVYRALLDQAAARLGRGQTVILDATYIRQADRLAARDLARRYGARFLLIDCHAPEPVIRERLTRRRADSSRISDGRWEVYLGQKADAEPVDSFDPHEFMEVDTEQPILDQVASVISQIERTSAHAFP